MMSLQVQPEFGSHAEIAPQAQGGVRRNGPLAFDNFVDAARRHAQVFRQPVLGDIHGPEKLLGQDFPRRDVA